MSVVQRCDQRNAADDVSKQRRREKFPKIALPGERPRADQIQHFDRAGDVSNPPRPTM